MAKKTNPTPRKNRGVSFFLDGTDIELSGDVNGCKIVIDGPAPACAVGNSLIEREGDKTYLVRRIELRGGKTILFCDCISITESTAS